MSDSDHLERREKSLQPSGGGDGVSLHIDSDLATQLDLDGDTEVNVELVEVNGSPEIRLTGLPTGISRDAFCEYCEERGWEMTDEFENSIQWSNTFRTDSEIRVILDNHRYTDKGPLNNLFIKSPSFEITSVEEYLDAKAVNEEVEDAHMWVNDSMGAWQQLAASPDHETDELPSEETMQNLIEKTEYVGVKFTVAKCSLHVTLDDLERYVEAIEEAQSRLG